MVAISSGVLLQVLAQIHWKWQKWRILKQKKSTLCPRQNRATLS
jgi:hypothetical protein